MVNPSSEKAQSLLSAQHVAACTFSMRLHGRFRSNIGGGMMILSKVLAVAASILPKISLRAEPATLTQSLSQTIYGTRSPSWLAFIRMFFEHSFFKKTKDAKSVHE